MDRLIEAIEAKQNPSVVGLDPTEALVPAQIVAGFAEEISEQVEDPAEAPSMQLSVAFFEFNRAIIDAVADIVPAVKPQIAMYETLGPAGIDAYTMTCEYAKQQGLYVLGDVKRGDIGFHHFQIFIFYLYLFRMTNYCRNFETTIQCFIQKGRAHKAACPDKDYLFHFLHILIYYNVTTI